MQVFILCHSQDSTNQLKKIWAWKNPGIVEIPGFLMVLQLRLTLRELRRTTCSLETVLSRLVARNPCIYLVFELILIPDKNKTIFAAGFAPYFVAFLANICPLFAAESASSDTNPSRKSLSTFYRVLVLDILSSLTHELLTKSCFYPSFLRV